MKIPFMLEIKLFTFWSPSNVSSASRVFPTVPQLLFLRNCKSRPHTNSHSLH